MKINKLEWLYALFLCIGAIVTCAGLWFFAYMGMLEVISWF